MPRSQLQPPSADANIQDETAPTQERHRVVPAVYLVGVKNGHVLLGERTNTGYCDGMLALVSGHVEADESPTQAMIREAKEEADLDLTPADLKVGTVMSRKSDEREGVDFFFLCDLEGRNIENREPSKCLGWKFYPRAELPASVIPYVRRGIEGACSGYPYLEHGWRPR